MKPTGAPASAEAPLSERLTPRTVDYGRGREGFRAMREQTSELCDLSTTRSADDFRARTSALHLGGALLLESQMTELSFRHSRLHVARANVDHYQVHLKLSGSLYREVGPRRSVMRPGDIGISNMGDVEHAVSLPRPGRRTSHQITLVLPRALLASLLAAPDSSGGVVIPGDQPYGRILRGHLLSLWRNAAGLSLAESESAIGSLAILLAGALRNAPGTEQRLARAEAAALLVEIKRYVERRLDPPGPSTDAVCRAFGISRASLYRLFEPDGGFFRYLRERQLRRAFATVNSPSHRHRLIIDIALEHGFQSESAFIRAFRRAYGITPGELRATDWRLSHLSGGGGPRTDAHDAEEPLNWIRQLAAATPSGSAPHRSPR